MPTVDLHVHSSFSARPSEWFLQRLGARESYTDPEVIYREARNRGMSYVTITDHNEIRGSLQLKERYPQRVFTGVEATAYFPENGCKVHVLIYGLDEAQFVMVDKLRTDIYQLRDYIKEQNLAHAVAHATYAVNNRLNREYFERLLLLFDYFEAINGSRSRMANEILTDVLATLTPEKIDALYGKYKIEPFSDTAWIKGLTGGTDDHSGLFIGKTFTEAQGDSVELFIEQLKKKRSAPGGRHNDYQGLAFAIYKIAYDFSRTRSSALSSSLFHTIHSYIFEEKAIGLKDRLMIKKMKYSKESRENGLKRLIVDVIDAFQADKDLEVDERLNLLYDKIAHAADHLFKMFIEGVEQDLKYGNMFSLINRISGTIPGIFLSLPFFTTMNLIHESRTLLNELTVEYGDRRQARNRQVLCFTDSAADLPDLQQSVKACSDGDRMHSDLIMVTCARNAGEETGMQDGRIILPHVHSYTPEFFTETALAFPSLLKSIKIISARDPDVIYLLSPGPVGLLGMLASRLLHIPCRSIYQPGYQHQIAELFGDDVLRDFSEDFLRWFYSMADQIIVGDNISKEELVHKGYDPDKLISSGTIPAPVRRSLLPLMQQEALPMVG